MALLQLHPWHSSTHTPFTLQVPLKVTKQRSLCIRSAFSCSNSYFSNKVSSQWSSIVSDKFELRVVWLMHEFD